MSVQGMDASKNGLLLCITLALIPWGLGQRPKAGGSGQEPEKGTFT